MAKVLEFLVLFSVVYIILMFTVYEIYDKKETDRHVSRESIKCFENHIRKRFEKKE